MAQCGTRLELAISTRGRVGMGAEDADGLAGLDQQRLVGFEAAEGGDDLVEGFPAARGLADAAVDDEVAGALGDVGVEVVHQHAERGFGEPALGGEFGAAGGADGSAIGSHAHAIPADAAD